MADTLLLQPSLPSLGAGEYYTPAWLFEELAAKYGPFTLDAAAQQDNAKCDEYFDIERNGLDQPWSGVVWCNPPYSNVLAWVEKAHRETCVLGNCERSVMLLPAVPSTRWFHDYALPYGRLEWIRGKVKFGGSDRPAMFPSVAVVFDQKRPEPESEPGLSRSALLALIDRDCPLLSIAPSESIEAALAEIVAGRTARSKEIREGMASMLSVGLLGWHFDRMMPGWNVPQTKPERPKPPKPAAKGKAITEEIKELLRTGTREGDVYRLPEGQLDRATYDAAMKVLGGLGFKWNRSKKAHVCGPHGQPERLWEVLDGGKVVDLKQELQFFPTPTAIVDRLLQLAEIGPGQRVLEPSAGTGNIAAAVRSIVGESGAVDCCEIHPPFVDRLIRMGFDTWPVDFLSIEDEEFDPYDRIVMNPPFAKGQDIEHVWRAHRLLKPGGVLVSVMHPGWRHGSTKREAAFREWIQERGASVEDVPAGAFSESGTEISTVIVRIKGAA